MEEKIRKKKLQKGERKKEKKEGKERKKKEKGRKRKRKEGKEEKEKGRKKKRKKTLLPITSSYLLPSALGENANLLFVFIDLFILDISHSINTQSALLLYVCSPSLMVVF